MSLPIEIEQRLDEIRTEIEQGQAELVDVLYRRSGPRSVLTFLVDKKGGITLEECAEVNRRLGHYFDRLTEGEANGAGFLRGSYVLEVSSPGLDRRLKTSKDFQRAVGQRLRIQTRDERGVVSALTATLVAVTDSGLELETDGVQRTVLLDTIFRATHDIQFKK